MDWNEVVNIIYSKVLPPLSVALAVVAIVYTAISGCLTKGRLKQMNKLIGRIEIKTLNQVIDDSKRKDEQIDLYRAQFKQSLVKEGGFSEQQMQKATALSTSALEETLVVESIKVKVGGSADTSEKREPAKSDAPIEEQPKSYQETKSYQDSMRREREKGIIKPEDE